MAGKVDLHRLYPAMESASVEMMALKVDDMVARYDREVKVLIDQYNRVIENPRADPVVVAKTLADKARLIKSLNGDASRIALMAQRQRMANLQKAKIETTNKATAVRLLEHTRKAAKVAGSFVDVAVATRPTKVKMYPVGSKFTGTVRHKIQMEEPEL